MNFRFALAVAACFLLLSACNGKYSFEKDRAGRLVLLNRQSGDISILQGDVLIKARTEEEDRRDRESEKDALQAAKKWPDIHVPQIGKATASLSTSWQEGRLFYRFVAEPETDSMRKGRQSHYPGDAFVLYFYDKGGFKRMEHSLTWADSSRTVDDKNKVVDLHWEDSTPCAKETYKTFDTWNLSWRF